MQIAFQVTIESVIGVRANANTGRLGRLCRPPSGCGYYRTPLSRSVPRCGDSEREDTNHMVQMGQSEISNT